MRRDGGWRVIVALAAPVVISKLSFTAMGLVDTAMVGRLGPAAQGSVGLATTYMFTLYVFGLGVLGVVNTYVAQYHGAGRPRVCGRVLGQGVRLAVIAGAVTLALLLLSAPLFHWAGLGPEVADTSYRYMFFRSLGVAGVFGYWAYNGFLEGIGDTRTPMKISILANVINLELDIILIFGAGPIPAMGVDGAGLATAISNLFMLVCFVWVVHKRRSPYREFGVEAIHLPFSWKIARGMVRIGMPMGVQFFFEVGAYLVFSVIIGWIGDVELAANQVAVRLMSASFMTAWGISVAATTLVGRHLGEEEPELAALAGWRSMGLMLAVGVACGVLFVGAAEPLARIFSPYPDVAVLTASLLLVAAVFQLFDGVNMVAYGALRGAGDTRWPMWAVIACNWGIGVPAVYLLAMPAGLGVYGAWYGLVVMMVCQSILQVSRFARGPWKTMRVVDDDDLPGLSLITDAASPARWSA